MSARSTGLLVAGNGASLLGDGMFVVGIGFAVFAVGGGPGALGLILLSGVATIFLCVLPAGVLVDRTSRRLVVVGADVVRATLQLVSAAIVASPGAQWWHLLPTSILFGAATALHQPASMSLTAEVVPHEQLEKVNGLIQALRGVGLVVGGGIAGAIVARYGPVPVMVVDAVTFYICALCIFAIRMPKRAPGRITPAAATTHLGDLRAGIAAVRAHRWLVHGLVVIAGFVVVSYAPIQVVGPAAAEAASDAAGMSAAQLWAWISAATAAGMIVGGVTAFVRRPAGLIAIVRVLLVVGGLGPLGLALDVPALATLPGFAAIGGAMGLFAAGWESAKQARIDRAMLARVSSLDMFAQLVGMIAGVMISAAVATFVSVDAVLWGIGLGCMLLGVLSGASRSLSGIFRERAVELEAVASERTR